MTKIYKEIKATIDAGLEVRFYRDKHDSNQICVKVIEQKFPAISHGVCEKENVVQHTALGIEGTLPSLVRVSREAVLSDARRKS